MRRAPIAAAVLLMALAPWPGRAVSFRSEVVPPPEKILNAARNMVHDLFKNLKEGKTEEIASWIVSEVGFAWDAPKKISSRNDFKSKLDIVLVSPPESSYGKLHGYDLIDEAFLPGSSRYFRFAYLSYHEGAPLIWEFRFYVQPDETVTLHYVSWNDSNPFEYLSRSDMLLNRWYER